MPTGFSFQDRHIGLNAADIETVLQRVGGASLDAFIDSVVPAGLRTTRPLTVPEPLSEVAMQARLREIAERNVVMHSMIGLGYADTVTPAVIRRTILENPAWYTAYTPYQPEISQGRLEALLNFQTLVTDLTGMDIANASLLDEATAAAEAMTMLHRMSRTDRSVFVVDCDAYPQTLDVIATRAEPLGIDVVLADPSDPLPDDAFGIYVQYCATNGAIRALAPIIEAAHAREIGVAVGADLLSLVLLETPGVLGADVVVGSSQRFGVPLGFGGPHAAFLAARDSAKRTLPGRLIGVSLDAEGRPALRLTLQTREQHIRREKATSNICTAQALLAVVASMYAHYHGPDGLRAIALDIAERTARIARSLANAGLSVVNDSAFDTITVAVPRRARTVIEAARMRGINLRLVDDDHVALTCDETTTDAIEGSVLAAFGVDVATATRAQAGRQGTLIPNDSERHSEALEHPVFHRYRSETELLRYIRQLADRDLALDRSMIPLGSCTMKLNAASEMEPISWPQFANLHPFAPLDQSEGYRALMGELVDWLADITGYDAVSLQPNAGSQGELAGLLAIRAYHRSHGDDARTVCLIPSSAHGTNAASAVMAGMRVVVIACDDEGNIDLDDCATKAAQYADELAALMLTYPSTHGVFEHHVRDVCQVIHDAGGQVYLDGANLNALVGLVRPGEIGADVSHLNLHKTFCIPHGGGGPGVGPIGVKAHLAPFLPNHPLVDAAGPATGVGAIAAAPWGSAGILPIPWAYIQMMGPDGLTHATKVAILAANYIATRLEAAFPVLYRGQGGYVAHECILDLRDITARTGVTVDDVAKRLMDYGFHAPTMSWPVNGTLMVEPTESESLAELDRFCDAMLAIRAEIDAIERGSIAYDDSPLHHAPHTAAACTASEWERTYSRESGAFPARSQEQTKYWPPVARIDAAYGDRNVVCACPPIEDYVDVGPSTAGAPS